MKQPALTVENLSVKYPSDHHKAIDNVSFQILPGSITALIGPNGAGKTSVVKAVLGIINHTGTVKVFNKPIDESRHHIGYVPQRFSFDSQFPITVYEFLHLALVRCDDSKTKIKQRIHDSLKTVDLVKKKNKPLSSLSGGQLQRVLVARALVHNPKILILDEPETGIDVGAEQTLYDMLKKYSKDQNVSVILASHELDVVYGYADQVICINKTLVCQGKPSQALTKETFQKLYGLDVKFYRHG